MINDKGQVVLILVLVMTVALGIGISVVQRSLSDVSTANKVEQSSRAFSAAEAVIEKSLNSGSNASVNFLDNNSSASVANNLIPAIPAPGSQQIPLEYPPLAKEETATVWLADPTASLPSCTGGSFNACYAQDSLTVYWGNPAVVDNAVKAALELTFVYYDSSVSQYKYTKKYLDQVTRTPANNFDLITTCSGYMPSGSTTNVQYQCRTVVGSLPSGTNHLMLLRARLLYNSTSQPFAVQAAVCPGSASNCLNYSIPPQARILTAVGTSADTQRTIQVFRLDKVVPSYFDYAIFSAGAINK